MHVSIALACIFKNTAHEHCMNGKAESHSCFVSMYVYMHLVLKELNMPVHAPACLRYP